MKQLVPLALITYLAVIALAGCSSSGDSSPEPSIVGTWTVTQEGVVKTFRFGSDGALELSYSSISWAGTYSITGDAIELHLTSVGGVPIAPEEVYAGTHAIGADGKTLTLTLEGGAPLVLQRA